MYNVLILMRLLFLSGVAGCIFSMNNTYDKGIGGDGNGSVYSVAGKFIDRNGNPIVGLKVQLKGDAAASAVTDSNCEY